MAPRFGDDAAPGYRAEATLSIGLEIRRQLSRRRTKLMLGLMVVLPVVLYLAFQFGPADEGENADEALRGLVDLATSSAANFAVFTLLMSASFLLVLVVALFCGDTVASEASWGSLRYLLAIPVPRGRLLTVKLTVGLLYSAVALVLLTGTALVVGVLAFGWEPLRAPVGGESPPGEGLVRVIAAAGYIAVALLPVASVAFFLSVSTDAPLGAVGGAILFQIVSAILEAITALGSLRSLLPTYYTDAWFGLLSDPIRIEDMLRGGISALVYSTIFLMLAWWRFPRKDVVS